MLPLFLILYSLFLSALALFRFRYALGLFIVLLPAYLVRFKVGPLPSTLLELSFGILFFVWLIKFARQDWPNIKHSLHDNKFLYFFISLFLTSSIISIFISDMWLASLGQWRAYFLEPILFFFILIGRVSPSSSALNQSALDIKDKTGINNRLAWTDLIYFLALSTLSISIFGLLQRFTGWHIGNVDWIALQTNRVTSFFTSPNAVGLYLAPITSLMIIPIINQLNNKTNSHLSSILYLLSFTLSFLTILLTKSFGAIVSLGVGMLLFFFLIDYKKTKTIAITIVILLFALCLVSPKPLAKAGSLFFKEHKSQSTQNRLTLWKYSATYLTASPKNFVFGTGIRQFFRKIQKPYYNPKQMERLIYPHNIFINFWTEIGLLGMVSFIGILYSLFFILYQYYKHSDKLTGAALLSTLLVFFAHGLIDVPYFKNDLSVLFWILAALIVTQNTGNLTTNN